MNQSAPGTGATTRSSPPEVDLVRGFPLDGRTIGEAPAYVIAEAGVNHDGDVDAALRLIDAAVDTGADAIKFQTFDPEALASANAPRAAYQATEEDASTDQLGMLRGLALPDAAWPRLQSHARDRGITFFSTPFDDGSANLLDRLDVPAFKVGSGELTNLPFLSRLAGYGRPILLSTGMATLDEVAAAVDAISAGGGPPIALFHCVSAYPADPADANLRAITTMRRAFGVPVGWSDHTLGLETATTAVALGASLIEKHLTLDRGRSGPDHRASLEPDAFASLVASIRSVEASLGTGVKAPVAAEREVASVARRSLHWRRDLEAGAVVATDDLAALRPATGFAPGRTFEIVGRRTTRRVHAGTQVVARDLEGWA
jgi:N-acetylneuraminate synthase/N,N'-diacetyllegionaminate synthase